MALYGSPNFKFGITSASGSTTIVDISGYIDTINGLKVNAMTQETHGFGDSWVEHTFTGVRSMDDITIGGFYNDAAATGPHALLGNTTQVGASRAAETDYGSSVIQRVGVLIVSYQRTPTRNELTRFEAVLRPTGAVSTAS